MAGLGPHESEWGVWQWQRCHRRDRSKAPLHTSRRSSRRSGDRSQNGRESSPTVDLRSTWQLLGTSSRTIDWAMAMRTREWVGPWPETLPYPIGPHRWIMQRFCRRSIAPPWGKSDDDRTRPPIVRACWKAMLVGDLTPIEPVRDSE